MLIYSKTSKTYANELEKVRKRLIGKNNINVDIPITWENREKLIMFLSPMVRKIANEMGRTANSEVDLCDLYSCGFVGLIDAVDEYIKKTLNGYQHSVKVSTYAYEHIRKVISEYKYSVVTLLTSNKRSVQTKGVQKRMGITNLESRETDTQSGYDRKTMVSENEFIDEIEEIFPIETDIHTMITDLMECLTPFEKQIVYYNYGIGINKRLSHNEILEILGDNFDIVDVKNTIRYSIDKLRRFVNSNMSSSDKRLLLQEIQKFRIS